MTETNYPDFSKIKRVLYNPRGSNLVYEDKKDVGRKTAAKIRQQIEQEKKAKKSKEAPGTLSVKKTLHQKTQKERKGTAKSKCYVQTVTRVNIGSPLMTVLFEGGEKLEYDPTDGHPARINYKGQSFDAKCLAFAHNEREDSITASFQIENGPTIELEKVKIQNINGRAL